MGLDFKPSNEAKFIVQHVVFICRCLLDHGADVAAVNNEGELPLDLAEEEDMEDLLTDEIERLGKP